MENNAVAGSSNPVVIPAVRLTITKLMTAVKQGNLEAIRSSLETYGLPSNGTKTTDYTILITALQRKHKDIAKLLIQAGCNVNNPSDYVYQSTPLYLAVELKDEEIIMMLLQRGAIIDVKDIFSGETPLHLAAKNNSINILWTLLHFNCNVNHYDKMGRNALQIVLEQAVYNPQHKIESVNPNLVRKFMEQKASLTCHGGPYNQTPLHLAALLSQRDILQILLPFSADLNDGDSEGNSILHLLLSTKYACSGTVEETINLDIVNTMLSRGARPDGINKRGQVPAHLAAKNKHLQVLALLLRYENSINRVDQEGKTISHWLLEDFKALDESLIDKYRQVLRMIVEKGGRGDCKSTQGETAIHLAARCSAKDPNALWLLVQGRSVDVNVKDSSGNTIMHIIAADLNSKTGLIKLLLTKGVKIDVKNKFNKTPIQIAIKNKHMTFIKEILPNINDANTIIDERGNTLLHYLLKPPVDLGLVEQLLQKRASVDIMNNRGLAPTFYAAESKNMNLLLTLLRVSTHLSIQATMRDNQTNRTLLHLILDAPSINTEGCEVLRILLTNGALVDQLDVLKNMPLHEKLLYEHPELVDLFVTHVNKINLCGNEGKTLVYYLDRLRPEQFRDTEFQVVCLTKMLLNCGASLEGTNARGKSVLDLACRSKNLLTVLFEYGQNMAAVRDSKGNSVLHSHLMDNGENRNLETVAMLIEKGVPLDECNKDGLTPMHLAASNGDLELLHFLVKKAMNVNVKNKQGNDVLHILLREKVKSINSSKTETEKGTTEVDNVTSQSTIMENEKELFEIIEQLLQKGMLVDGTNNAGETHLHLACRSFRVNICKQLLQQGADPQARDKLGNNCLHFMSEAECDPENLTNQKEMIWYFLSLGCGANDRNNTGCTALHTAARRGKTLIVEALMSSGADINCVESIVGATPLHFAAVGRYDDLVELFVKNGADINARQKNGCTVLQLLLCNPLDNEDEEDISVSHILSLGADVEARDNLAKTALHYACWHDNLPGLRELLKYGASFDAEDFWGFPPLHYATDEKTKLNVVLYLIKLQMVGVNLSKSNKKIIKETLVSCYAQAQEIIKCMNIEAEVAALRQVLIDGNISLYDLLHMNANRLSEYQKSRLLQDLINSPDFYNSFPHYSYLIKGCNQVGKNRSELLMAATESLSRLSGICIPIACSTKIFNDSLSNENLRYLIKAGVGARPSRKRQSSYSENGEERPAKHRRSSSI